MPRFRTILIAPAEDADALIRGAHALGDERVTLLAREEQPRPSTGEFVGLGTVVSLELDEPTTQTMEGVFEHVLHVRSTVEIGKAIGEMIRSYNLDDKRVRNLWEGFTGHRLTQT